MFLWSSWGTALVGLLVAALARSFNSALVLFVALGLFHGGTYTPSLMVVAQRTPPARRGNAIGMLLAASSLGYAGSIACAAILSARVGYQLAFAVCGGAAAPAALVGWWALRDYTNVATRMRWEPRVPSRIALSRLTVLLMLGYTAHCWELLGMWAWMPAFLLAHLGTRAGVDLAARGVSIGLAIHLSGCIAAFLTGRASDRFGRRAVLIALVFCV